jgi:predicted DNA-binding transcriptional regulator AlpA
MSRLKADIATRRDRKTARWQAIAEQQSREQRLLAVGGGDKRLLVGGHTDKERSELELADDLARLGTLKFIRRAKVKELTGLSDATLWRYERRGLFPHRVVVTEGGNVAWVENEVLQWLHSRVRSVGKRPSHIAPARFTSGEA